MSDKPKVVRRKAASRGPASRRSLSNTGGPVEVRGDKRVAELLAEAMSAGAGVPDSLEYTHGFHSYPARLHPAIPRVLLAELNPAQVLDPFCGGGTVLVESLAMGAAVAGTDLNPLAVRVASARTELRPPQIRERFVHHLRDTAVRSEDRVRTRVPVRAALSREELAWYEMHTVKELAGLLEEIRLVPDPADRRVLETVFSAIVVKFSQQNADTSQRVRPKRIRKGLPTEFFLRKGIELSRGWRDLVRKVPANTRAAWIKEGDIRDLPRLLPKGFRPDLILTSPPYGGTYDYLNHHRRRFAWLGLSPSRLKKGEMGARRNLSGRDARRRWEHEVAHMLKSMRAVCVPETKALFVVGDPEVGGEAIAADRQVETMAKCHGFVFRAVASQSRRDYRGKRDRKEHLVALEANDLHDEVLR